MGAWGHTAFENDTACDWVWKLEETNNTELLHNTLDQVMEETGEPDAIVACEGLAAAEVVAAMNGGPHESLPDDVKAWLSGKTKPDAGLIKKGRDAAAIILKASELRELWEESEWYEPWKKDVEGLIERLT
jgi:hypothetical protein